LPRIDAFCEGQTLRSGRQKLKTAKDQPEANPPQSPQLADDF
jgi:hypothetical protein